MCCVMVIDVLSKFYSVFTSFLLLVNEEAWLIVTNILIRNLHKLNVECR